MALVAVLALVLPCSAAQVPPRASAGSGSESFVFRVEQPDGATQVLRFALSRAALSASRARFRAYDPDELRALATADARQRTRAAIEGLVARFPHVQFTLEDDSVQWRVGPPPDFRAEQARAFDAFMARRIDTIRADFPAAEIQLTSDGRYRLRAPDQHRLGQIQRRLEAAQRAANAALADHAQDAQRQAGLDSDLIRGEIAAGLDEIAEGRAGLAEAFFRQRMYRVGADHSLLPDYAGIARAETGDLAALAAAVRDWADAAGHGENRPGSLRDTLGLLLRFVQSIPYDPLADRSASAGFLPPLQVLAERRGDCDSKAVLFAAVAHGLYPTLPLAMVLLPDHAYLALGIPRRPGDAMLDHGGRRWTLAEPVGPGLLPIGVLGPDSAGSQARIERVVRLFN